ncbi:hypothetical protein [Streptomyces noursei]|uniref:hypothetical protein n=1 Tax=Streptomyces noursei TaxID=1971 RepID=UPI00215556EF|nr:hypothetical protein [Streptomyces noursei]
MGWANCGGSPAVVFTWDPTHLRELWLLEEYLPEIRQLEHARFTPLSEVVEALDAHTVLTFAQLPPSVVEPAIEQLRVDLESGAWQRRHADLFGQDAVDYGYRLLVAGEPQHGTDRAVVPASGAPDTPGATAPVSSS